MTELRDQIDPVTPDPDSLEGRVLNVLPNLTLKQRRLARALLEDPIAIAFSTAEEVGRRANVDAATVVRFSRLIGYDGYAGLRNSVRTSVPRFLTSIERVQIGRERTVEPSDVVLGVFAQDIRNVEETARLNPPEMIATAVERLCAADRVFCVGHGISTFVADHLAHQLSLVGVAAHRAPRSVVEGAVAFSDLQTNDVVVVVSVWRYLLHSLMLAEAAHSAGAFTIGLTDSKASPLTAHSDIVMTAATETAELGHSVSALITLTTALVTGVALAHPERALERLARIDNFYAKFQVMTDS